VSVSYVENNFMKPKFRTAVQLSQISDFACQANTRLGRDGCNVSTPSFTGVYEKETKLPYIETKFPTTRYRKANRYR
jgi:hypothetical protein